jgi:crotonobetainyl-CoA:carnitine CoA-transferase CaiB-like acyl-CoA transferase
MPALTRNLAAFVEMPTRVECEARFVAADYCLTPALTVGEALEFKHVRHRGLVRRGSAGDFQAVCLAPVEPMDMRAP